MIREKALSLAMLLGLALPALAEVGGNAGISVTSTSATTTFTSAQATVCLINCPISGASGCTSANKLFARVFTTSDTAAAATTSSPIRLEPGDSMCLTHNTRFQRGIGWLAVSYVTSSTETATLKLVTQ